MLWVPKGNHGKWTNYQTNIDDCGYIVLEMVIKLC